MIAGIKSGSGKTTLTVALLNILKRRGMKVMSFKCGPDYIDPIFHETVLGVPSKNLDTFFTPSKEELMNSFIREMKADDMDDMAVIEGVMGLYDGVSPTGDEGSSYEVAAYLDCPIILVADVKGMGRSMIPMLSGFLKYDAHDLIKGVVLNRISDSYYEKIAPVVEDELGIKVLGHLRDEKEAGVGSRHLGLILPEHEEGMKEKLEKMTGLVDLGVDIDQALKMADSAPLLTISATVSETETGALKEKSSERIMNEVTTGTKTTSTSAGAEQSVTTDSVSSPNYLTGKRLVMVARDEAFSFYYKDNLAMLEDRGAVIRYFSPIKDETIPDDADVIILGGGYPELFAGELSRNQSMLRAVRKAYDNDVMLLAECGGFMYLQKFIEKDGKEYEMCNIFDGKCRDMKKSVRFGYIEVYDKTGIFIPAGESVKGHEFHYWDCDKNGAGARAVKVSGHIAYDCCRVGKRCFAGFPHLYYPSNSRFVSKILS